jgi:hypothetical protein
VGGSLQLAHDIAVREELRWGYWRLRLIDGQPEFADLTCKENWRTLATKYPLPTAIGLVRD